MVKNAKDNGTIFRYGDFEGELDMFNLKHARLYRDAMDRFLKDSGDYIKNPLPDRIDDLERNARRILLVFDEIFGAGTADKMFGKEINATRPIMDALGKLKMFSFAQTDDFQDSYISEYMPEGIPKQYLPQDHRKKQPKNPKKSAKRK